MVCVLNLWVVFPRYADIASPHPGLEFLNKQTTLLPEAQPAHRFREHCSLMRESLGHPRTSSWYQ
jgi:hypothetical protein